MTKKSVFFFCMDHGKDEVAPRVFEASARMLDLKATEIVVDGYPVLTVETENDGRLYYVRTKTVICMEYDRYLPIVQEHFSDCDLAVMVNWHGGANAPDQVLCIHTVGDVTSGIFGASEPILTTHLARLLEHYRQEENLDAYRVTSEATHWSGVMYGGQAEWISETPVPFIDVEIGSTLESYSHPKAAEVIAKALADLYTEYQEYPVLLYCGGIHFEETITQAILHPTHPVALTHILPSRWIENENYAGEQGQERFNRCIDSIRGGIAGFVIHEKLKRDPRETAARLAEEMGLPVIKRKALKNPEQTVFYME